MSWKQTIPLNQLQQKGRHCDTIDNHKILLIWHKDTVHAVASQCPHFKLPLTKAQVTDDDTIICPFHQSSFDLKTGASTCWSPWPKVIGPVLGKLSKPKPLAIYPVRIEDGMISINISSPEGSL